MYRILMVSLAVLFLVLTGNSASAQQATNAFYDEGIFAYEDGNYNIAETAFQKALDLDPQNPYANHFLGKTYIKMEQYKKAGKYIEKAWKLDAEMPDLAFDRAFLYYKLEKYGKAAALFKAVLEDEPARIMARFYCGVSLYRDRQYQKANPYLLAAVQGSPDLKVKAYYFSGLCHYYMDQQDQALERMNFVKTNTDSEEVRANAERWIQTIQAGKQERKPYKVELLIAYEYDDNVPLEPDDPEESIEDDLPDDKEDFLISAYAAGEYNLVNQENFILGAGLSRYQSMHSELDEYDSSETSGKLYARYKAAPFSLGLQVAPKIYQLDGEDYLLKIEVNPTASYAFNQQWSLWLSYTYADKDYRDNDTEIFKDVEMDRYDASSHEVFLDDVYILSNDMGFLLGGIGYEISTADENKYDYNRLTLRLGGSFNLPYEFRLGLLGSYAAKSYLEKEWQDDDGDDAKREDARYKITVSLARQLYSDWLEIAAELTYTKNNSDISNYEYTRNQAGIGLIATF